MFKRRSDNRPKNMPDAVSALSVNRLLLSGTLIDSFVLRLKGVACKEDGDDWEFLGLLPMFVSLFFPIISQSQWPH